MTEDQVVSILRRIYAGERGSALAHEFGVGKTTISAIKRGQNWRHMARPDIAGELRK